MFTSNTELALYVDRDVDKDQEPPLQLEQFRYQSVARTVGADKYDVSVYRQIGATPTYGKSADVIFLLSDRYAWALMDHLKSENLMLCQTIQLDLKITGEDNTLAAGAGLVAPTVMTAKVAGVGDDQLSLWTQTIDAVVLLSEAVQNTQMVKQGVRLILSADGMILRSYEPTNVKGHTMKDYGSGKTVELNLKFKPRLQDELE